MKFLSYKGMMFDDYVKNDDNQMWSQVCSKCINKYHLKQSELDTCGSGICGIEGCNNESSCYIDFDNTNVQYIEK